MKTLRTLARIPDQRDHTADQCGLIADVLEPSPRYTPSGLNSFDAESTSTRTTNGTNALNELRLPRRIARIGFSEFLD